MTRETRRFNSGADSCPPRLKPWATQPTFFRVGTRSLAEPVPSGVEGLEMTGELKPWATRTCRFHARAVLLLEVVVALAVMVSAMGLLGAQLVGGIKMTMYAEEQTRATQLADRMLAVLELDPNTLQRFFEDREIDGDFDEQYVGWFWRATVEELPDDENLGRVTIEILHQRGYDSREDIEDAQVVRTLHMLKANPGRIDLAEDFGIPEEHLETLREVMPDLDPAALDPLALVSLDPETLLELLPVILPLLQQFGMDKLPQGVTPDMLNDLLGGGFSPGDLSGLISGADLGSLGGGGNDAILQLIQSQLGGQLSEEDLNQLLSSIGQGGFGGGSRDRGSGDDGGGGGRGGRDIGDLNREREERNRKWEDR